MQFVQFYWTISWLSLEKHVMHQKAWLKMLS